MSLAHEDDVYIRDCADNTDYSCDDNQVRVKTYQTQPTIHLIEWSYVYL